MSNLPIFTFARSDLPKKGTLVVFTRPDTTPTGILAEIDLAGSGQVTRAIAAADFKAAAGKSMAVLAPAGTELDRLLIVGLGSDEDMSETSLANLGGSVATAIGKAETASVVLEDPTSGPLPSASVALVALGILLRSYSFDTYKSKKADSEPQARKVRKKAPPADKRPAIALMVGDTKAAKKAWTQVEPIANGTLMARDLINEPANVLGPQAFADRAMTLKDLGVDVQVLDEKQLAEIGMRALLGVAQGSARPARVVVMRWNGGKAKDTPVAFVGKGVVFDTGGISIKPASGMEDMKGDMGGAAAVVGAMHAIAGRKAKCNVVGIIGCVENMPDGNAQRPGDIVTSLSGQTIEIINTDAEGRLVLGDLLTYVQRQMKPKAVIDLATLTGAVIVALGHHHAGVFSNDDDLAANLISAGLATGDKAWRLPIGPEYDKLIDSRFADMKNTGGRWAGSITAAQFLHRFVEDGTIWAHIDLAGTAMGSPDSEINRSWGSGYGVRLLDRLISDHYE